MTSESKTYFTGRPCAKGHVAERRIANRSCTLCLLENSQKWRIINKDKLEKYRKDNADRIHLSTSNRRARKKGAGGKYSFNDITLILREQLWKCVYCYGDLTLGYSLDHKTPLSRGGTNWPDNIQATCVSCNSKKHTRTHEEYIEFNRKHGVTHVYTY